MGRGSRPIEGYVTTGNHELDNAIGGGIPFPSLTLIEGNNDSGKTVISQQLLYGALLSRLSATVITTENTIRSFLAQMQLLHLDVSGAFIQGRLKVVPIHVKGVVWTPHRLRRLLATLTSYMGRDRSKFLLIDSLTYMLAEAEIHDILTFLTRVKKLTEPDSLETEIPKAVVGTVHRQFHGDVSEQILVRIRSLCDAHVMLTKDVSQGQVVRSIEIAKLKGSKLMANKISRFEIHPAFGVRIVPTSEALA